MRLSLLLNWDTLTAELKSGQIAAEFAHDIGASVRLLGEELGYVAWGG